MELYFFSKVHCDLSNSKLPRNVSKWRRNCPKWRRNCQKCPWKCLKCPKFWAFSNLAKTPKTVAFSGHFGHNQSGGQKSLDILILSNPSNSSKVLNHKIGTNLYPPTIDILLNTCRPQAQNSLQEILNWYGNLRSRTPCPIPYPFNLHHESSVLAPQVNVNDAIRWVITPRTAMQC